MNSEDLKSALGSLSVFRSVDAAGLADLAGKANVRDYAVAETIVKAGDEPAEIYFLLEGTVQVQVPGSHVVSLEKGAYFGEASLIDGEHFLPPGWRLMKRTADVVTLTPARAIAFHVDELGLILRRYPEVRKEMAELGAKRTAR